MLPSSSQLSKNAYKSPRASFSALLLNSTPQNFPTCFPHIYMTGEACRCAAALFQVRALLHFCTCSPKQGLKVPKLQDFHKYIWVCSWLQAESYCFGRLWSKVWAQFSLRILAKDLLTSKPACRLMQETQRKEAGMEHTEKERKERMRSGAAAASTYLLKNIYMTSVPSL